MTLDRRSIRFVALLGDCREISYYDHEPGHDRSAVHRRTDLPVGHTTSQTR